MAEALAGKVALITGAAQGIGKALAIGLAGAGATVVVGDVNGKGASATAQEIAGKALRLDVTNAADIASAIAMAGTMGGLDILINNAGVFPRSPVLEMSEEEWDRVLTVNLKGTFL